MISKIIERLLKVGNKKQMERLEDNVCIHKVRSMMMIQVPDELEVCKYNCDSVYQINCPNYKPCRETPLRKGKIAYEVGKKR